MWNHVFGRQIALRSEAIIEEWWRNLRFKSDYATRNRPATGRQFENGYGGVEKCRWFVYGAVLRGPSFAYGRYWYSFWPPTGHVRSISFIAEHGATRWRAIPIGWEENKNVIGPANGRLSLLRQEGERERERDDAGTKLLEGEIEDDADDDAEGDDGQDDPEDDDVAAAAGVVAERLGHAPVDADAAGRRLGRCAARLRRRQFGRQRRRLAHRQRLGVAALLVQHQRPPVLHRRQQRRRRHRRQRMVAATASRQKKSSHNWSLRTERASFCAMETAKEPKLRPIDQFVGKGLRNLDDVQHYSIQPTDHQIQVFYFKFVSMFLSLAFKSTSR